MITFRRRSSAPESVGQSERSERSADAAAPTARPSSVALLPSRQGLLSSSVAAVTATPSEPIDAATLPAQSTRIPVAGAATPSLTERLVNRIAGLFDRNKSTRRSFLARTAVVGSALAVDPWGFTVKPASAYATICGPANTCSGGYTVFCCTINGGANLCPPGSFAGGWWKADSSAFCCGSARYYVDCNASCGSGWGCRCNNTASTCDQRLVACNQFRYGQCHQEIACYGPVVCRLITCTPPWQYTAACSAASATDNATADHSAPCLPGYCPSASQRFYYDLGGPGSFLGWPTQSERRDILGRGNYTLYQHGAIYSNGLGTFEVHGPIWDTYRATNTIAGALGYPISSTVRTTDGAGVYNFFQNGVIIFTFYTGAREVHTPIAQKWYSMGSYRGVLGYPITSTWYGGKGSTYAAVNSFQHGAIYNSLNTGCFEVHGAIYNVYLGLGSMTGPLGLPITNTWYAGSGSSFAAVNTFQHGAIYSSTAVGTHALWGPIYTKYVGLGSMTSRLGLPTNGLYNQGTLQLANFQHGYIGYDTVRHVVTVHYT